MWGRGFSTRTARRCVAFAAIWPLPAWAARSAGATPVFLTPIDISAAGQDGFEGVVAIDSTGRCTTRGRAATAPTCASSTAAGTQAATSARSLNISDPGQNASDPDIAVDPSNNVLVTWSRSDGTNIRIQAAFKPAAGSFAAPVTVSDPGFDATKPEIDFDNSGRGLLIWQRFDGTKLRVQATTRSAGVGGTYANETTLSEGGQDAFNPKADAGPDVDANAVTVWTRTDGTKLRVQSARRRDVTGFPRPKGATPTRVALVPPTRSAPPPTEPTARHWPSRRATRRSAARGC